MVPYALPISAGVTLYVAASDLIPEINRENRSTASLVVFLGVALYYMTERVLETFGL
jgi:zinc transporter ZupT